MKGSTKDIIQWHPAFHASIQIEFKDEAEKLTFDSEHLLSKKPMQMDELIIKVTGNEVIHKNIGRIFRRYNIVEYKSPDDYLTINDFYKVYGYCCVYQSDTEEVYKIPPEELTITFICNHYPRKMIQHLKDFRKLDTVRIGPGIYYITGDPFPIQLLVTKELNPNENRWLQSLRNDVSKPEEITTLLKEYEKNKASKLYQAAMNVITRANWNAVKEVKESMCEALRELMADEFKEQEERVTKQVTEQVTEQITEQVTEQVTEQITTQIIKNLYDTIKDVEKIAALLKMPVEQVERVIKK